MKVHVLQHVPFEEIGSLAGARRIARTEAAESFRVMHSAMERIVSFLVDEKEVS